MKKTKKRLPTGQLGEIGENLVVLQALARGALFAYKLPLGCPEDDVIIQLEDNRQLRIQVKTRRAGDWQTHYKDHYAESDPNGDGERFWVFVDLKAVDLGRKSPKFYIMPAGWVENYIHEEQKAYLARRGITQEQRRSRHWGIKTKAIEQWRDRWELLELSDVAQF